MATRHQRRKAMRARKDAKAQLLLSRAMRVLQEEQVKANLSTRMPRKSERALACRGFGTDKVHRTTGAHGKALFDVANEDVGKRGKPSRRAHSSYDGDDYALQGAQVTGKRLTAAKAAYSETLSRSGYPKRDDTDYLTAPKRFAK